MDVVELAKKWLAENEQHHYSAQMDSDEIAVIDEDVREFIIGAIDGVELEGLCPICGTRRSQNGECWLGHIVIDVNNSATTKARRASAAQHSAQSDACQSCGSSFTAGTTKKDGNEYCPQCGKRR